LINCEYFKYEVLKLKNLNIKFYCKDKLIIMSDVIKYEIIWNLIDHSAWSRYNFALQKFKLFVWRTNVFFSIFFKSDRRDTQIIENASTILFIFNLKNIWQKNICHTYWKYPLNYIKVGLHNLNKINLILLKHV
jgi:hypothetical protein